MLITFTHVEIRNILSFGFNEVEQRGFFIHRDRKKFFILIGPRMVFKFFFCDMEILFCCPLEFMFETSLRIFLNTHLIATVCRPVCGRINMIMMESKLKSVFTLAARTMGLQVFIIAKNWRTIEISGKV